MDYALISGETQADALVRLTYPSGKVRDYTLAELQAHRPWLEARVELEVEPQSALDDLDGRIAGVAAAITHLPAGNDDA